MSANELFTRTFPVGWGDLDSNAHMSNTTYLDRGADGELATRVTSSGGWLDLEARQAHRAAAATRSVPARAGENCGLRRHRLTPRARREEGDG